MSANLDSSPQAALAANDLVPQYFEALNTGDPERMLSFYSPRSVLVASSGTIYEEDKIRAWYQRLFNEVLPNAQFLLVKRTGAENFYKIQWTARERKSIFELDGGSSSAPIPGAMEIYRRVYYKKIVRTRPRAHTAHIVSVDLNDPAVDLMVTPPEGLGNTTSRFLSAFGLQLAINGDEWTSWTNPKGLAVSEGFQYSAASAEPTTYISPENQVWINGPRPSVVWDAISGSHTLVRSGEMNEKLKKCKKPEVYCGYLAPRTSMGITSDNRLILIVVEGRPGALRDALTIRELASLNLEFGAVKAICMDGGGSSTLAVDDYFLPRVLNTPSDGSERAVSNHLGIRARYLDHLLRTMVDDGNDTLGLLDGKIIYHYTSFSVNESNE